MEGPRKRVLAVGAAAAALVLPAGGSGGGGGEIVVLASDRAENRQPEVYTVGADGRRRVNVSRRPASDSDPVWSPDAKRIAFLSFPGGRPTLVVTNANGRARRVLATERGVGWISGAPSWSPDGRRIAFASGSPPALHVRVVAVASRQVRVVARGARPVWSADGREIAFLRDDGLWTVRPDGTGTVQVATGLDSTSVARWAPRGRRIAYSTFLGGAHVVDVATRRVTTIAGAEEAPVFGAPAWSPDGRRLVFARALDEPTGRTPWSLVVANADGTGKRELTTGLQPAWSADGRWIALIRILDDREQLYAIRPDGSGERRLATPARTAFPAAGQPLAWAPRGTRLAYTSYLRSNDRELYSMRPNGTRIRQLTRNAVDDAQPRLSPDGSRIAFSRSAGDSGRDLFVMGLDGRASRRLVAGEHPSWSPDGRELAFAGRDASGTPVVAVIPLAGGTPRALTPGTQPTWSPRSAAIAYVAPTGAGIAVVTPDGAGQRLLASAADVRTVVPGLESPNSHIDSFDGPTWSPDGTQLLFYVVWNAVRPPQRRTAILVDADGSDARLAWFGGVQAATWSPDGRRILLDTGPSLLLGPAGGPLDSFRNVTGDWIENDDPDWRRRS